MKLYVSPTSPFARKVRIAIIEKGLDSRIDNVVLDPWASPEPLLAVNPLSQVPTLVNDDGLAIPQADTILGYLEWRFPQPALLPEAVDKRSSALALAALAQGALEASVQIVLERRRPAVQQSEANVIRRHDAIERTLEVCGESLPAADAPFDLGAIGLACALSYLDFRLPDLDWRQHRTALAAWHQRAQARPSMQATAPPA